MPVLLVMGVVVGVGIFFLVRRKSRTREEGPILVFPASDRAGAGDGPRPAVSADEGPRSAVPGSNADTREGGQPGSWMEKFEARQREELGVEEAEVSRDSDQVSHDPDVRGQISPEARAEAESSSSSGPPPPSAAGSTNEDEPGSVAYERIPDGTLQLLPGSLQIQSGPGVGEEIRFARVPGEQPVVTFGRSSGPAYRHVQLRSPTVSRRHAKLIFRDRQWVLQNQSSTNPTVVDGRPLDGSTAEVTLQDGARIEMGEIVFQFRHLESSNRLALRSSWYTDRGRRPTNQDAVAVRTLPGGRELAVVCDGMGSHASGGVASHIALEALVDSLSEGADLGQAVQEANRAIHRAAAEDPEREGMGTTLVALLREGNSYAVVNVGDSRAYRVDGTGLKQLTRDHSFVAEAVGEGGMSLEEANRSPWRNAVTRNLGADAEVEVDLFGPFDATDSHLAILTTDGVHGVLSDADMEDIAREAADVQDLARSLGEAALMEGGEDNVAVAALAFSWNQRGSE